MPQGLTALLPATSSDNKVDSHCIANQRMARKWRKIHDLRGGTDLMRDAGPQWLPAEEAESAPAYAGRINRSVLYAIYDDTINKLAAKPFCEPVDVKGELPEKLEPIEENADRNGKNLTQFTKDVLDELLDHGVVHVLVDYPPVPASLNLAQERALGVHPYFSLYSAPNVLGWKYEMRAGQKVLTQLRLKEERCEPDGDFGEKVVGYVRVWTEKDWTLWREGEKGSGYSAVAGPDGTGPNLLGKIPLVTMYARQTGFMTADPPLLALADLNIAHWQASSDNANGIHFASFGMWFMKGLTPEQVKAGLVVGPSRAYLTTNPDADAKYLEPAGTGLQIGTKHVEKLELMAELMGLQPLMQRSGDVTATAHAFDNANNQSNLQSWIRIVEAGLEQCFELAAEWVGAELDEEFSVDIFNKFGLSMRAQADIEQLIKSYQAGIISKYECSEGLKARSLLPETYDFEKDKERIAEEGIPLGMIGEGEPPREGPPDPNAPAEPVLPGNQSQAA